MAHTEKSQKLDVLLALAMADDKQLTSGECPDEEMIACYFDQQLSESEKQQFFRLLLKCPNSYAQWTRMAETLGYHLDEQSAIQASESKSWVEQLKYWLTSYQKLAAAMVVVGVTFFVVLNLNAPQMSLQQQMEANWQEHQKLYLAQMDVSEYLARRQTKSTLTVVPFAEKTAFSHGFKKALQRLSVIQNSQISAELIASLPAQNLPCDNTRCEQETLINQHLGSWSALILQQCQQSRTQTKVKFWQNQQTIYNKFNQEYKTLEQRYGASKLGTNFLNSRLQKMNRAFAQLPGQVQPVCDAINQLALYALQK